MAYSKITSVEVQNFMSYEATKISFDESGIINIKGYNDSGKSALLRAIMVCLYNINKTVQTKWIREGTDYFRVVVNFDDGISILRDKYRNGQSLYEMYKDKKLLYTTKQGNKLSKVDDVPQPIKDYIGFCETENGCLNYQSCTDKMLLVETTGSENYAMLNEVLKTDEIVAAQKMMRYDMSANNSRQQETLSSINTLTARKESYEGYDEKLVEVLKSKNTEIKTDAEKKEILESSMMQVDAIKGIVVPPEVDSISVDSLESINDIVNTLSEYKSVVVSPEVNPINEGRLKELLSIVNNLEEYNKVPTLPEVESIKTNRIVDLMNIIALVKERVAMPEYLVPERIDTSFSEKVTRLKEVRGLMDMWVDAAKALKDISKRVKSHKSELSGCITELKANGVDVEICPNCGEAIVAGQNHLHA